MPARKGSRRSRTKLSVLRPREIVRRRRHVDRHLLSPARLAAAPGDGGRRVDVRGRGRPPRAARSTARRRSRRVRSRGQTGRGVGGGRARPLSPDDAEGRPGARPLDLVPPARRCAPARRDDAETPRDRRGVGGRARGFTARRARSRDHGDRQPAAAIVAAPPARGARADPRSPRRRRGVRVPDNRARQAARHAQRRTGSRAPGRACRPRHRWAARSRRPEAVARGGPTGKGGPRRGPVRRSSALSSPSSTTWPMCATASTRRSSTTRRR